LSGRCGSGSRRLLGLAATAACVLALPSVSAAEHTPSVAGLQAQNARIAGETRSAVLDLYSLDTQLARAQTRLDGLRARERGLQTERATLKLELRLAHVDTRLSQQRLASRVRFLYDHGTTTTLDLIFGARSIEDAMSELDDFNRVTSVNDDVLQQLQTSETRLTRLDQRLTNEQLSLDEAEQQAAGVTAELTQASDQRTAYVAGLESQRDANAATISALEAQAQAAELRSQELPVATTNPVALAAATAPETAAGVRTLTVSATGYSLPGRTASGLPVGWGVIAVDPSVIPLGTHLLIPGYGEAVAADTGSAVVGDTIDLWFPSVAQADAWGRRSVTIAFE
jgi:3D (Asp-Asp-Asp) domain-containing protein